MEEGSDRKRILPKASSASRLLNVRVVMACDVLCSTYMQSICHNPSLILKHCMP